MGVTGYEVKMYSDIARIALALEAQEKQLARIARVLEHHVYGITAEDLEKAKP